MATIRLYWWRKEKRECLSTIHNVKWEVCTPVNNLSFTILNMCTQVYRDVRIIQRQLHPIQQRFILWLQVRRLLWSKSINNQVETMSISHLGIPTASEESARKLLKKEPQMVYKIKKFSQAQITLIQSILFPSSVSNFDIHKLWFFSQPEKYCFLFWGFKNWFYASNTSLYNLYLVTRSQIICFI